MNFPERPSGSYFRKLLELPSEQVNQKELFGAVNNIFKNIHSNLILSNKASKEFQISARSEINNFTILTHNLGIEKITNQHAEKALDNIQKITDSLDTNSLDNKELYRALQEAEAAIQENRKLEEFPLSEKSSFAEQVKGRIVHSLKMEQKNLLNSKNRLKKSSLFARMLLGVMATGFIFSGAVLSVLVPPIGIAMLVIGLILAPPATLQFTKILQLFNLKAKSITNMHFLEMGKKWVNEPEFKKLYDEYNVEKINDTNLPKFFKFYAATKHHKQLLEKINTLPDNGREKRKMAREIDSLDREISSSQQTLLSLRQT